MHSGDLVGYGHERSSLNPSKSLMPSPIRTAPAYSKFDSNDKLAKSLIEKYPDVGWALTPRSLATKIGMLDNGDPTWWLKREKETARLAELLELSVADLGVQSQVTSHLFSFPGFPGLKPLDLKREKSWVLAEARLDSKKSISGEGVLDHWLEPAVWSSFRPPSDLEWLHVPDDLERKLLVKSLAAAGNYEVLIVETLADAADPLRGRKPLVVSVEADGGEKDLMALVDRPERAGLLVIAPFMPAVHETTISSSPFIAWEQRTASARERRLLELTDRAFNRFTWTLLPDWRERLLKEVEARLNRHVADTHFSAQGVKNWLERFDAHEQWFSTTSDLMHLCQIGHSISERKLPAPNDPDAGKKLVNLLFKEKPLYKSMQIQQLAEARWNRSALSWRDGLPMESWLSLASPVTGTTVRNELDAIAQGKTQPERKKAADRVAKMLEAGNPDALLSSGLIKKCVQGNFDFEHPTLAGLLVRDRLMRQIAEESLASWALACFDSERRLVVDAALDAVSLEHLIAATERLLQEVPDSAVTIGASEALFMAVGRRILNGMAIPSSLMPIAKSVIERLDVTTADWALPDLWSRPLESEDEKLAWITACWSWSLLPNTPFTMPDNWWFPGWSKSLPELPYWLSELWPDEKCEQVSLAWRQFFTVTDEWLKDMEQPMGDVPRILRIGFLMKAAHGAWPVDSAWWNELINCHWAEGILLKQLQKAGAGAAARLWPCFLVFERNFPTENRYLVTFSRVRVWLLQQLKPVDALSPLGHEDRRYLLEVLHTLPPELRAALLESLAPTPLTVRYGDELAFFERFGLSSAPALALFLAHEQLGRAAAVCMWRWDADKALRLLRQREKLGIQEQSNLLEVCPAGHVAAVAVIVCGAPKSFDPTLLAYWARRHLPNAGGNAESLLAIIKMVRSDD